jgi:hypothetical protein
METSMASKLEEWNLDGLPHWMAELCDSGPPIGGATYALVYGIDADKVLKLTDCAASQIYLSSLETASDSVRDCFPTVYESAGKVGTKRDGRAVYAFVVERLYGFNQLQGRTLSSAPCPRVGTLTTDTGDQARKQLFDFSLQIDDIYEEYIGKNFEQRGILNDLGILNAQCFGYLLARALTETKFASFTPALRWLAQMSLRNKWMWDLGLALEGNVMATAWGEPMLSDPVYSTPAMYLRNPEATFV